MHHQRSSGNTHRPNNVEVRMVTIFSLWLPILVSAVFVFVASSIMHMVLGYHNSDFKKLPDEDGVMDGLSSFDLSPGDYVVPCPANSKDMKSPEYQEKLNKGPVLMMTVMPSGQQSMGGSLMMWFVYSILVGVFAAYISTRAIGSTGDYLDVFRFVGATSFVGYSMALMQSSIWYKRSWAATFKSMFDGLVYALLTAGTFGWLWPA
jgi:hypothetical protein